MQLIDEIEISYFRSFYKIKLRDIKDLNIIFGKNDSGKSNIVRALNLFFNFSPDHDNGFEFPIDFNESRAKEANESEDVRKFLYVKVTFNTPPNYKRSLGKRFYVKRQWTVTKGEEYTESFSSNIPPISSPYSQTIAQ
jgi:AAA15 family ATPase/GTPase